MKMIVAITPTNISEQISDQLIDTGFGVTKFASTAGFLQGGTTTLMIGVEEDKLEEALDLIREEVPHEEDQVLTTIYVINIKNTARI